MLYQSGDVEKNPGPEDDNISDTASSESFPVYNANFSVVHYNVQSVKYKLDIIEPEFSNFSVVALKTGFSCRGVWFPASKRTGSQAVAVGVAYTR